MASTAILPVDGGEFVGGGQLNRLAEVPSAFPHVIQLDLNQLDYFLRK